MMKECARTLPPMIAICRAMASLARMKSPHVKELVPVCRAICNECKASCEAHAGHHAECKGCFEACTNMLAVLDTLGA
jgi:hypothetical protein